MNEMKIKTRNSLNIIISFDLKYISIWFRYFQIPFNITVGPQNCREKHIFLYFSSKGLNIWFYIWKERTKIQYFLPFFLNLLIQQICCKRFIFRLIPIYSIVRQLWAQLPKKLMTYCKRRQKSLHSIESRP